MGPFGGAGMLRNPAYAGRAAFAKTTGEPRPRAANRVARLAGRSTPTAYTVTDRPRQDWLEIPVPASGWAGSAVMTPPFGATVRTWHAVR
jgi:hypothetical protein